MLLLGLRKIAKALMVFAPIRALMWCIPVSRNFLANHCKPPLDLDDSHALSKTATGEVRNVDWVAGAAMVLSPDFLRQSGGFDPQIFLYGEDEDLCIQAKNLGFRVETLQTTPIVHKLGWGSDGGFKPRVARMKYDSLRYFIAKNVNGRFNRALMRALLPFYVYGHHFGHFFVVTDKLKKFVEIAAKLIAKQNLCDDSEQVDNLIQNIIRKHKGIRILSFVNAHAVMRSTREADFFNDLMKSKWLLRDGIGMVFITQRAGVNPGLNLNGTDFIPRLLQHIPTSWKLALLGTQDPCLGLAAKRLRTMGFEHISMLNGFHSEEMYVEHVHRENPDLVVLAMGMPKQERIAQRIAKDIEIAKHDMLIVNGGAILDFLGGGVPRAPYFMRRCGMEWLYRLLYEPRRMYPRFRDSVVFALLTQFQSKQLAYRLSQQTNVKNL